jgi:hypothetical protein
VTFRCGPPPVTILVTESLAVPGQAIIDGGNLVALQAVPITITGNRGRVTGGGVYTCCGGTTTIVLTTVAGNTPNNVVEAS